LRLRTHPVFPQRLKLGAREYRAVSSLAATPPHETEVPRGSDVVLIEAVEHRQRRSAGQRVAGVGVRVQEAPRDIVIENTS